MLGVGVDEEELPQYPRPIAAEEGRERALMTGPIVSREERTEGGMQGAGGPSRITVGKQRYEVLDS